MKVSIQPSTLKGTIIAPSSKSAMQRACALALLHDGETIIHNPGKSNDDLAALDIIQKLGALVRINNEELIINNVKTGGHDSEINCGESGLSIRMFAPIAALSSSSINITGEGSLLQRPMNFFDEIFPQLGVEIVSNDGKLPIKIKGPLQPKNISIDGSLSSQFLTGLLMAFAKAARSTVTISVTDLKSKPYIDLTLQMMKHFGYEIANDNYERFIIQPSSLDSARDSKLTPSTSLRAYTVEGDWSGASFLLVAGAIAGEITIKGLDVFSTQADKAILQTLIMTGANLSVTEKEIIVSPPVANACKAFHFNATDCPDLFPPLVALAAYCEGTSVIEGVSRLIHKESNRAISLQQEFAKMGVEISLQDDMMLIKGGMPEGANVHSHHDHRIAMACAVAALKAKGVTSIEEAGAINKSYPGFYEDLKMLGADVSLT